VSALVLLSGCGWFGGGNHLESQKARPGADRTIAVSGALPSANPGRYEPGYAATDETRTPRVGSIVAAKGGQKAQKEATEKEAAERDAKDREAREAVDREQKAKEKDPTPTAARSTVPGLPGRPAAAEPGNANSSKTTPVTAPGTAPAPAAPATPPVTTPPATTAPPPAPVTSTPVPPPPADTPPASEPPAPSRTSLPPPPDAPAAASASPSRWAPPGGVTPAVATADQRPSLTQASARRRPLKHPAPRLKSRPLQ
jgi:hypothetical protein